MRRFVPFLLALTTVAAVAAAPAPRTTRAHPDFSGTWNLDVSKSEGAMMPTSATLKVTQAEKVMTVESSTTANGMSRSRTAVYNLDGSPSKNSVTAGGSSIEFTSTVEWTENVLVIKTTAAIGAGFSSTERWSMSDDKKSLTIAGDVAMGPQTMSNKQTFAKQ